VTVKFNAGLDVLPAESRPVQLTAVEPSANMLPEEGVQVTVGLGSTLSMAVTVNVTALPEGPAASAVWLPGPLRVGADPSLTVIVKVALA
jgi:hypothetical protein